MKLKIGGGDHLQAYDEDTGQYADDAKAKILEKDMENLVLVYVYGMEYGNLKFHFPRKGIHDKEYCEMFVKYIRGKSHLIKPYIDSNKLDKYLFKPQSKDDKSKFMIEVLGFENNSYGWNDAKEKIIESLDFKTMKLSKSLESSLKVIIYGSIIDVRLNSHNIVTVWSLEEDLTLRFITLIPRRK